MKHGLTTIELHYLLAEHSENISLEHKGKRIVPFYEGLEQVSRTLAGPLVEAPLYAGDIRIEGRLAVSDSFGKTISIEKGNYVIDRVVSEPFIPGDKYGDFFDEDLPQLVEEEGVAQDIAQSCQVEFDPVVGVFQVSPLTRIEHDALTEHTWNAIQSVQKAAEEFTAYLAGKAKPLYRRESDIVQEQREI